MMQRKLVQQVVRGRRSVQRYGSAATVALDEPQPMSEPALFKCVIMGPPGSGKGTISERILRYFDMVHISAGDKLRSHIRRDTKLGRRAARYLERGALTPDSLVSQIIAVEIVNNAERNWLLDGYPRTTAQAQLLHTLDPVSAVIELDVPFDVIVQRLANRLVHSASGRIYNLEFNPPRVEGKDDVTGEPLTRRKDDEPEVVRARLDGYEGYARPVSDYFTRLGLVKRFAGNTTNEIWPHVYKFLSERLTPIEEAKL